MSIAIVETSGSVYRVIGPNQEIIHNGSASGNLIGYSSNFMVFRSGDLVTTVDERGSYLGRVSVDSRAEVFGVTNSGFMVRPIPGQRYCHIFGPSCENRGGRDV